MKDIMEDGRDGGLMMDATMQVRAHELKSKSKADLSSQLTELKQELLQLRVAKVTGGNTAKLTKM